MELIAIMKLSLFPTLKTIKKEYLPKDLFFALFPTSKQFIFGVDAALSTPVILSL